MKNLEIIKAEYIDNYKISVIFNDGKSGIIDLENELWGKVFEPLKEGSFFKDFIISDISNTLEWKNGADFSPEFIYNRI